MFRSDDAPLVLTIDLDAVAHNWLLLGRRLTKAKTAAVVKADAYGLGATQVVPRLVQAGCAVFFVATLDEAIVLRPLAPQAEIFVLSGPIGRTQAEFVAHDLIPVLNDLEQIRGWAEHGHTIGRKLKAALQTDSGMTRMGLDPRDLADLILQPDALSAVEVVLGMSHLACANEPGHPLNEQQRRAFIQTLAPLTLPRLSLAASSGIFLGTSYEFDLVRPGAALYGVNPVPHLPNPMRQTVRLQARILQIRDVDSPQTVGYGASHAITAKGRLATVAAGYADGYLRSLGGRGMGVIEGIKVPVVGRISMDLITFDISAVPSDRVAVGQLIDLIGPDIPVDAVADQAGTIGYEILTQLSRRAVRHYHGVVL